MAINGMTNMLNTKLRMTGMVSGFDTDTMVKQILTADRLKLDKLTQKRETAIWRTEAYREITSTLKSFYSEYFDTLSTKNLKSANSYASFSTAYASTTSTDYISVTALANAKAGTYSITDIKAATAAALSGTNVSKPVEGLEILDVNVANISFANDNNKFVFTFNNKTVELSLNESGALTTVQGLQAELQSKIDTAFGSGKITVGFTANGANDGGKLSFSTVRSTDSFNIGTAYNDGSSTLFSVAPTTDSPFVLIASNNKFELTIGGVTKTVTVPLEAGGAPKVFTSADDLAAAIKSATDTAFGGSADITFKNTNGKVTYTSGQSVSINKTANGANVALGIDPSNMSNKLNLTTKIGDIKGGFNTALSVTGIGNDLQFTINGKFFRFNSKDSSINDIIKAVNADTTINATMKYDITTNSFKVESKSTGATDKVVIEDRTGNLMQVLGIAGTDYGTDASVNVNGTEIVRPTNSFSYDGLTFDIKKDFSSATDPIKATVSSDTTKTYEFIKGFVDKYNEMVGKLNTKTSEKVYKDYAPLTDEQREALSEDQIKKWEEKAKSGLLKNDSIISSTLSSLRSALYASVEGVGITLSSIGITTSSNYEDKGKLVINETKLKEALATKPEEVAKLFTNSSDVTYYDAINSSTSRSQRYKESGIAHKFSDIIQDAIRTNTDKNGNKGTLLEKAGIVGDRSEFLNILSKEIKEFDDLVTEMNKKLTSKETALYNKFAAMESALNKMNSQSSWLTQQFGNNS